MNNLPLVSIMIPNRNHSRYLGQCIESALSQTYRPIDIVVLDNCSDDDSIETASRYIDRGVRLCKNPLNIINASYDVLVALTESDYLMLLCADDLIKPGFVERCVSVMEEHPRVGYVHCERDYMDASGNITDLDPFYSCSFISPGESALPIYLLTDVAQPSQCLFRRTVFERALRYETEFDHANADKDLWFKLSLFSDYAYLRTKLALIRIHEARETTARFESFFHPLAIYLSLHHQVALGMVQGHHNVLDRLPKAQRRLASESVQVAISFLRDGKRVLARRYLLFARIVDEGIVADDRYQLADAVCNDSARDPEADLPGADDMFVRRTRSYDPPRGFKVLDS